MKEQIRITVQPAKKIQRAHDLLLQLTLDQMLGEELAPKVILALDVLCWVLCHDHNPSFQDKLNGLEQALKDAGFELVDGHELTRPKGPEEAKEAKEAKETEEASS